MADGESSKQIVQVQPAGAVAVFKAPAVRKKPKKVVLEEETYVEVWACCVCVCVCV
jgi:hypothetical protein